MKNKINPDAVYVPSSDVVAREIEGEIIIVPLVSGLGDLEDELFTLNETGRETWRLLDGQNRLEDVTQGLYEAFEAPAEEIEKDVIGFLEALLKMGVLVEASQD